MNIRTVNTRLHYAHTSAVLDTDFRAAMRGANALIVGIVNTHPTLDSDMDIEAVLVTLAKERDVLLYQLDKALVFVDIHRRASGGDGDICASNIRHLLKQAGRNTATSLQNVEQQRPPGAGRG